MFGCRPAELFYGHPTAVHGPRLHAPLARWIFGALVLGSTLVLTCSVIRPSTPDGMYYDPDMSTAGSTYWTFRNGAVYLKTPSSAELKGAYTKSNGVWVSQGGNRVLEPTVFGLKAVDPTNRLPSHFLFRRGFGWIADFRNWIVEP